jgi:hypothetical protein
MSKISCLRTYLRRGSQGTGRVTRAVAPIPLYGPAGQESILPLDPSLVTHKAPGSVNPILPIPMGDVSRSPPNFGPPFHPTASVRVGSAPLGNIPTSADVQYEAIQTTEDAVIAELQGRLLLIEGDNDTLRVQVHALQEDNASVIDDIAGLRLTMADLEGLIMREIVGAPEDKKRDPRIKTTRSSPQSGDVRNRLSIQQLKIALEDASSEEETSEEEDEARMSTVILGPVVPGLTELTTRRPEFRNMLSYRHYRLAETTQKADASAES